MVINFILYDQTDFERRQVAATPLLAINWEGVPTPAYRPTDGGNVDEDLQIEGIYLSIYTFYHTPSQA